MIPQAHIIDWRHVAPWNSPDQVEHDVVLSRAIDDALILISPIYYTLAVLLTIFWRHLMSYPYLDQKWFQDFLL
jgi:hypothetical protein